MCDSTKQTIFLSEYDSCWGKNEVSGCAFGELNVSQTLHTTFRRNFAVIDVETNENNEAMSIGIVIADSTDYKKIDYRYYILTDESKVGGLYSQKLRTTDHKISKKPKDYVIEQTVKWLNANGIKNLLSYGSTDKKYLPELSDYCWRDIMEIARDKKHNEYLSKKDYPNLKFTKKGKLKKDYGVESLLRIMYDPEYCQTHNAIEDAMDELIIMELLNHKIADYPEII